MRPGLAIAGLAGCPTLFVRRGLRPGGLAPRRPHPLHLVTSRRAWQGAGAEPSQRLLSGLSTARHRAAMARCRITTLGAVAAAGDPGDAPDRRDVLAHEDRLHRSHGTGSERRRRVLPLAERAAVRSDLPAVVTRIPQVARAPRPADLRGRDARRIRLEREDRVPDRQGHARGRTTGRSGRRRPRPGRNGSCARTAPSGSSPCKVPRPGLSPRTGTSFQARDRINEMRLSRGRPAAAGALTVGHSPRRGATFALRRRDPRRQPRRLRSTRANSQAGERTSASRSSRSLSFRRRSSARRVRRRAPTTSSPASRT